jgi:hypothetical protein
LIATERAKLIRCTAEALGYHAHERRPRESLNRFVEILGPDGRVFGSAAGKQSIDEIIEMAWQDALSRMPDWTDDLDVALAALGESGLQITLETHVNGSAWAQVAGFEAEGASPAEALCRAWLAKNESHL